MSAAEGTPVRAATVQLFEVSTAYQLMVLAAAIDAGAFAPADERVLLVTVNTPVPEIAGRPDEAPGVGPLLSRFDRIVSLNDLLAPMHPAGFKPRPSEQPLFERLLLRAIGVPLDAAIELVVESVQAPPSRSLVLVLGGASVTVYAEGLMSYGPTREALPPHAGSRIRRVLHLDLVPGLRPLLLTEYGVEAEVVPDDAFRAVVEEVARAAPPAAPFGPAEPYALVIGQYLAQLGLLSVKAETALMTDLVRAAVERGFTAIAVKPHPSAPAAALDAIAAAVPGVRIEVLRDPVPVEAVYATTPPALVLGCFSTGLITANRYWSIPAATKGAATVLAALPRIEDSNRIPLVIVDRVVPPADGAPAAVPPADAAPREAQVDVAALQRIVETVGYCMQWRIRGPWRAAAAAALRDDPSAFTDAIPQARLRRLALPGGGPVVLSPAAFDLATRQTDRAAAIRRRLPG